MKAGWKQEKLGDVCDIIMGQSPDGKSYNSVGQGVPLINGPVEFSNGSFGETVRTKFTTQPTKLCKEGDLILCVRGSTTGRMNIAGFDACIGRGVAAIRAKQFQPWINYFVSSKRDEIHGKGTGATFPNVSGTMLANFELLMPPLPEQQRIVAILDEAFEAIAAARANAEQNRQNARALLESYLQSVFSQRGDGWAEKPLEKIAVFSQGIQVGLGNQSTEMTDGMVRFIRIVDYTQQTKDVRFIQDPGHRYWVTETDIVMVRYGTPGLIGRGIAGVIANNLFKISVSECVVSNDYLSFFLGQSDIQHYLATQGSSTMPALTFKQLGKVAIAYPQNKLEQAKIVHQVKDMLDKTKRLEFLYQRKIAALDELKQSLLQQAFSGQL